ncbi:hypothetical protein M8C13_08995 [Crossiella sp. SN42]|uniref:hypothetical protein n=1 Tax=Crossiella sp. SN42 TaxID=2944808 RepID=UPI00207CDD3C|nr:hypothetical protein [Crossiella sp. SN42]MCO1575893.1 hypothetical protein [Crossiella sp. SN42]
MSRRNDLWAYVGGEDVLLIMVFGLKDDQLGEFANHLIHGEPRSQGLVSWNAPTQRRLAIVWRKIAPIVDRYDWTNPLDQHDIRIWLNIGFLSQAGQRRFHNRRGTVTIAPATARMPRPLHTFPE